MTSITAKRESEPERDREALALIGELFRIERQIAEAPTRKREVVRQRESKAVVERFFAWCRDEATRVLDETPLAKGIRYALNQRAALERFLEDARLPVHNNGSENALRRVLPARHLSRCARRGSLDSNLQHFGASGHPSETSFDERLNACSPDIAVEGVR